MGPSCRAQDTGDNCSTAPGRVTYSCANMSAGGFTMPPRVGSGDGLFRKDNRRNGVLMTPSIQRWDEGWQGRELARDSSGALPTLPRALRAG